MQNTRPPTTRSRSGTLPFRRQRAGAATVEFALCLPLLVFLFVITVDFGRYFHVSTVISQCARNGALYMSQPDVADHLPYLSMEDATLADAVDLKSEAIVRSALGKDELDLPYVQVTVEYPFQLVTQFPGIQRDWQIVRTSRMRTMEDDDD